MRLERSRTSWRRVATVVFVVIATLAAFLVAGTAPAQARINSEIVFTDAVLKHVDQSGNPVADRQEVWQGDHLEFDVNYDGSNTRVAFGDEFTIELPGFLRLQDTTARRPMTTADGTRAGECALNNTGTNSTISCVFKEAVRRKKDVKGSIRVNLQVAATTTAAVAEIRLNGRTQTIPLPYDKPVAVKPTVPWQPAGKPSGQVEQLTSNSKGVNWDVTVPGAWLNTNYPSGSRVVMSNTVTPGSFSQDSADWAYSRVIEECADPRNPNAGLSRVVADGIGKSVDGFRLKVDISAQQSSVLTMNGPWSSRCNYHVKLRSLFNDNQTVDKSATYVNTTSFENVSEPVTTETRYQETFASTVSYRDAGKVMLPSGPVETPLASESA
ncbi:Ig-like domain-containing protein [Arachnia propionica]|uniref:SDR-like Ig domain-containing protein n=1 Tax=Arachnia propionica TaxID=1750 RepID=A0AB37HXH7_9ACTN|nr:Ig-like domain-containing protein [Arachnia propionica]QUC11578.1 hypothetical protein J5A53_02425 [Arachnia propionica]